MIYDHKLYKYHINLPHDIISHGLLSLCFAVLRNATALQSNLLLPAKFLTYSECVTLLLSNKAKENLSKINIRRFLIFLQKYAAVDLPLQDYLRVFQLTVTKWKFNSKIVISFAVRSL